MTDYKVSQITDYKVGDYIKCTEPIWRCPHSGFPSHLFDNNLPPELYQILFETTQDKLYKIENIFLEKQVEIESLCCHITNDVGDKVKVFIYKNKYKKHKTIWYYIPGLLNTTNHCPQFKRGKLISKIEYFTHPTELEIDMMNYNL